MVLIPPADITAVSSLNVHTQSRQDEGGLRPAGSATAVSALAATTTSIGIRRAAAVPSGGNRASADDNTHKSDGERGGNVCAAVAALQDCLVSARRAVLAVTSAALRVSTFVAMMRDKERFY